MPLTAKGEEIKSALEKEYGTEKGERVLYAGKNKGTFTGIDSARTDAIVSPPEYKRLVKARDNAKSALTALYQRQAAGEKGLNFRNLEADYTMASNALAAAQMKMTSDSASMTRIADAVNNLQQRFDAICARKDEVR